MAINVKNTFIDVPDHKFLFGEPCNVGRRSHSLPRQWKETDSREAAVQTHTTPGPDSRNEGDHEGEEDPEFGTGGGSNGGDEVHGGTDAAPADDTVPPQAERQKWSLGAELHATGGCKPCNWFAKNGCTNGRNCRFCHMCTAGDIRTKEKDRVAKLNWRITQGEEMPHSGQTILGPSEATLLREEALSHLPPEARLAQLEVQKTNAVALEDFLTAQTIKAEIEALGNDSHGKAAADKGQESGDGQDPSHGQDNANKVDVMILSLSNTIKELLEIIKKSDLAKRILSCGVSIHPDWARGATVLVDGLSYEELQRAGQCLNFSPEELKNSNIIIKTEDEATLRSLLAPLKEFTYLGGRVSSRRASWRKHRPRILEAKTKRLRVTCGESRPRNVLPAGSPNAGQPSPRSTARPPCTHTSRQRASRCGPLCLTTIPNNPSHGHRDGGQCFDNALLPDIASTCDTS